MVLGYTDSVLATGDGGAGVDTAASRAGQLARTILVIGTLHSRGSAHTTSQVGIASGTSGTLTLVASIFINTPGTGATGIAETLINIQTSSDGVTSVSSLTETLRRICGGAVSIDTALKSLTRTLTLASIRRVSKEWRRTDTLTWLYTLLIGSTVIISAALNLIGGTQTIVGIAGGAQGTNTAEGSNLVLTQSSKPTRSGGCTALVNICTSSIWLGVEASWTGTVGHSSSDGDTLGSICTVSLGLAALQDTVASGVNVVWWRTATVCSITGLTRDERIAIVSSGTLAVKTARKILTESILTTDWILRR